MKRKIEIGVQLDGKNPIWSLYVNGQKVDELSYLEVLEFALNATSALRWERERSR
jgi:hypothetical protein